ncbi:TlpA family protein disulfide reductase [Polluticoccus soli]|uniref:TlpA family protein disulfide reductase n=1 Tax=Polluticoccus soli TaxID=3034150 RepID=UPI0023E235C0|nr:TlpA family protein disulfide reductase [Flavipsychrobacter sp. JY13-12]
MQRSLFTLICLLVLSQNVLAKDGYRVTVKMPGVTDSIAFLAHYYGKPLPTIYKSDSAFFDKTGTVSFKSKDSILGGIYMILLGDKKTYFEFLLDNGDEIDITAPVEGLPYSLKFKNSPANDDFLDYMRFLKGFGEKQEQYNVEIAKAKTKTDTTAINKKYETIGKSLVEYRRDYAKKHPERFLTDIFNAMEMPEVPKDQDKRSDGTIDSMFNYTYYKSHYWDKFDFTEDRLINTPIFDAKLDEYMNKLVLPLEDSVIKESDMLLAKARPSKDLFKYTLWWLTRNAETSKIMGMDAVFVYLVENYFMKGDAWWLEGDQLQKYVERAHSIAPNVIGNLAPEIKLPDINNPKLIHSLHDVKAKYTLVVFWAPDCGHCQKEMPILDSLYKAVLKGRGVKIYAVKNSGTDEELRTILKKDGLTEWIHVHDPQRTSRYRADYDIYSTPVIYLLDEKKIIRGKRLDHSNIVSLLDMLERKQAKAKS